MWHANQTLDTCISHCSRTVQQPSGAANATGRGWSSKGFKESTGLFFLLQCRLVLSIRLVFAELKHADVALISLGRRFLCLFVNSLPLETCLRVWDLFFFEQCASSLFRVALALVDIYAQVRTFFLGSRMCAYELTYKRR